MQATLFTLLSLAAFSAAAPLAKRQVGESLTGQATFYAPGLGSCGQTNTEADLIAATAFGKAVCGDTAVVTRGGKSVTVTLVDTCPSCAQGNIDLSPAAFNQLGTPDEGRIDVTWVISGGSGSPAPSPTTAPAPVTSTPAPAPAPTYTPTSTTPTSSGGACTEGEIVCNSNGTWSQCGSGMLQLQGAVPPGMACVNGAFQAA